MKRYILPTPIQVPFVYYTYIRTQYAVRGKPNHIRSHHSIPFAVSPGYSNKRVYTNRLFSSGYYYRKKPTIL